MENRFANSMKVAIFDGSYSSELEEKVNKFLEKTDVMILEMKYTTAAVYNSRAEMSIALHSCMIIYQKNE